MSDRREFRRGPVAGSVLGWLAGLAIFAALLILTSGIVPTLRPVAGIMDRIGFEAGHYRISLFTGARVLVDRKSVV